MSSKKKNANKVSSTYIYCYARNTSVISETGSRSRGFGCTIS